MPERFGGMEVGCKGVFLSKPNGDRRVQGIAIFFHTTLKARAAPTDRIRRADGGRPGGARCGTGLRRAGWGVVSAGAAGGRRPDCPPLPTAGNADGCVCTADGVERAGQRRDAHHCARSVGRGDGPYTARGRCTRGPRPPRSSGRSGARADDSRVGGRSGCTCAERGGPTGKRGRRRLLSCPNDPREPFGNDLGPTRTPEGAAGPTDDGGGAGQRDLRRPQRAPLQSREGGPPRSRQAR